MLIHELFLPKRGLFWRSWVPRTAIKMKEHCLILHSSPAYRARDQSIVCFVLASRSMAFAQCLIPHTRNVFIILAVFNHLRFHRLRCTVDAFASRSRLSALYRTSF